ncbi:MAG: hypothetical protein EPN26_16685 [Rhodospirillales bacterium]|nr:MAG: hypothetical protein EPN26_16685 [Rhodospirillales bacterium]
MTVFAWSPEDQKEVDANGYPLAAPMNDEVRADLAERQLAAWKKIRNDGTFSEYRTSPLCQREVELDERHDSEFIQFLDFATGKNVEVQLVFLPAIWLESCENNLAFNRQIMDYVNSVAARYDGRVRVIDMNNGFDHAFLDVRHYSDLEHFTPESAIALSREAARLIGTK